MATKRNKNGLMIRVNKTNWPRPKRQKLVERERERVHLQEKGGVDQ